MIAGSDTTGDENGLGTNARFFRPAGMVFDKAGNLYVADSGNQRIRRIRLNFNGTGDVSVDSLAGTGLSTETVKDETANTATFSHPFGLAYDEANNLLYVSERLGYRIQKIILP